MQHLFLLFSNAYLYKVHLSPAIFKSGRPFETSLSRDGYCIYFAFVFPLQAQHFDNLRNPHSCKSNRPHPYQRRSVILSFGRFSRFSNRLAFQHLKISSSTTKIKGLFMQLYLPGRYGKCEDGTMGHMICYRNFTPMGIHNGFTQCQSQPHAASARDCHSIR